MEQNGRDYWDSSVILTPGAQAYRRVEDITSPYAANRLDLTIFVSCYNEEETILQTLETLSEAMKIVGGGYEIVVIDDRSQDHSVELVRRFIEMNPSLNIILRINKRNMGLACNYVDAAFIGCGRYYLLARGSGGESLETMVDVLRTLGEADIIVPYYIASFGSHSGNGSAGAHARLMNAVTGNRINSYGGLHIHLRFNVLRWHVGSIGAGFQPALLCRLLDMGFTCKQVPCRSSAPRPMRMTWRNALSILHMLLDTALRRASRSIHRH